MRFAHHTCKMMQRLRTLLAIDLFRHALHAPLLPLPARYIEFNHRARLWSDVELNHLPSKRMHPRDHGNFQSNWVLPVETLLEASKIPALVTGIRVKERTRHAVNAFDAPRSCDLA